MQRACMTLVRLALHLVLLCIAALCSGGGKKEPRWEMSRADDDGPAAGASRLQAIRELITSAWPQRAEGAETLREHLRAPPYLSVVVAMRNDDYGGHLLHRFERGIADLAEAALLHGLHYELVIVEWNPPSESPQLRDAVRWPESLLDVLLITVPPEVHTTAGCHGWEYEAKNLGVAASRGSFVLTTNADIILSAALIEFMAAKSLRTSSFYRADRFDCIELIPRNLLAADAQRHCIAHAVRHLYSWGLEWYPLPSAATPQVEGVDKVKAYRAHAAAVGHGVEQGVAGEHVHDLSNLHHMSAGDFILMAREHWHTLRGFPRDSCCQSCCDNHTDSYMVVAAAALGLTQVGLHHPRVLYHQEHYRTRSASPCPPDNWATFVRTAVASLHARSPCISNPHHWHVPRERCSEIRWSPLFDSPVHGHRREALDEEKTGALDMCQGQTHVARGWRRAEMYTLAANKLSTTGEWKDAKQCFSAALDTLLSLVVLLRTANPSATEKRWNLLMKARCLFNSTGGSEEGVPAGGVEESEISGGKLLAVLHLTGAFLHTCTPSISMHRCD